MTPDETPADARRDIAVRGLTPAAVMHLTRDALGAIDLAALAPVKKLLKRYFSDEPWSSADDRALADLVGPGEGWWRYDLDAEYALEFGWRDDAFRMLAATRAGLADTFNGPVVPEATPNPRTIRFVVTAPIHDGPSRWYESADGVDDPRVARVFAEDDDVANVLVGPAFVAVGLRRPNRWEQLLDPMLRTIAREFASGGPEPESVARTLVPGAAAPASRSDSTPDGSRALDRAWKELGSLRPNVPADLDRILSASTSSESAERQVAARLLVDAPADPAEPTWEQLLGDTTRGVRRATVDAMVDAERPSLRGLLERALGDADAWTRWKALRGLVDLGIGPSEVSVRALIDDPDFRVRLEASRALGRLEGG